MEKTKVFSIIVSVVFILSAHAAQKADAALTNGDFSEGFGPPWVVESGNVFLNPFPGGEGVLFWESSVGDISVPSILSQTFTLDTDSQILSFDVAMESGSGSETDIFTATLLDIDSSTYFSPSGTPSYESSFYYWDNDGYVEPYSTTVNLDVSSLAGREVFLLFELNHCLSDAQTSVNLMDVNVSAATIPAPASLVLSSLGIGLIALLRKAKLIN